METPIEYGQYIITFFGRARPDEVFQDLILVMMPTFLKARALRWAGVMVQ